MYLCKCHVTKWCGGGHVYNVFKCVFLYMSKIMSDAFVNGCVCGSFCRCVNLCMCDTLTKSSWEGGKSHDQAYCCVHDQSETRLSQFQ